MDWQDTAVKAILAITPVVVFVLVWLLKLAWSKIPASFVLYAAPVVGVIVNFVISYLTGHEFTPILAAIAGLLATTLREWITTIMAKGWTGEISKTAGSI